MEKPDFIDDITLSSDSLFRNWLYCVILRSPAARGKLIKIHPPRLPNGITLISAWDIPGVNRIGGFGPGTVNSFPLLAAEEISYLGEPVALLTGPQEAKLRELAALCRIEIQEAPPLWTPADSQQNLVERHFTLGDTKKFFDQKDAVIVEGTYFTGIEESWGTDTSGALVIPRNPGCIIHTTSQWPSHVRASAAAVLGLPPAVIEVRPARLELHLDGKMAFPSVCSCLAALASYLTQRPVKLALPRREDFRFSPKRAATEITIRNVLGKQGQILASDIQVSANMGAYGLFTEEILDQICLGALGAYNCHSLSLDARGAKTNLPPSGPLAGFGLSQGFFAMERQASRIADTLREDPAEWRKNNFIRQGNHLAIGAEIREQVPLDELLDTAAAISDYKRKWAAYELLRRHRRQNAETLRGIGITTAWQGSSFLYPSGEKTGVELTLNKDGSLEIRTGMIPGSEEELYPWKVIAVRELGLEEKQIRILAGGDAPDSGPLCLSRKTAVITKLIERACAAIRKQRFRDPLPITVRRYYTPAKVVPWSNGAKTSGYGGPLDENALASLGWGCAVVEVEIDPVEYIPRVRGIWLAIAAGPIFAENRARRTLTNLSLQAINWASREKLSYEEGAIPDGQIRDYPLLKMDEAPPIKIDFLWGDGSPRGIGELPFAVIPAAYAQALSQAMDYPFVKLPLSARDIWELAVFKTREEP